MSVMDSTSTATLTDPLLFLSLVSRLEHRRLISRQGVGQPFSYEAFCQEAEGHDARLRIALGVLESSGWLNRQGVSSGFFSAGASEVGELPAWVDEGFMALSPGCQPEPAVLARGLELAALNWHQCCPRLIQGLDLLLALALLRGLKADGVLEAVGGHSRPIHAPVGSLLHRSLDFLLDHRWLRREADRIQPEPGRQAALEHWLSDSCLAWHSRLPMIVDDLLFAQGEPGEAAVRALETVADCHGRSHGEPELRRILASLLDTTPLAEQPDWIVALGASTGAILDTLWPWLRESTARGRVLERPPLRAWVAEADWLDDPASMGRHMDEVGLPPNAPVLWVGLDSLDALLSAPGDSPGPRHRLGRLAELIGDRPLVLGERHPTASSSWVERFACRASVGAADAFMALAGAGLFADPDRFYPLQGDASDIRATVGCYQARDYRVRFGTQQDLPALLALEEACWPEGSRVDDAILRRRLAQGPANQLVLEHQGYVVGVIYSQRISRVDGLFETDFAHVDRLCHARGEVVQIQSLNILPAHQYSGYGDQLLEFMLQYCTLLDGVHTVVGVTRCKDYPRHRSIPLEAYIHTRDERGRLLDPVLRFHELHGAQIERSVAGYRPADHDNQGHGVLVRYDLASRQRRAPTPAPASAEPVAISVNDAVRQAVNQCLGQPPDRALSSRHSLMELGLDSADLLSLGEQLGTSLGLALEQTFFFRHNSIERIVVALEARLAEQAPSAGIGEEAQASVDIPRRPQPDLTGDFAIVGISGQFPGGDLDAFRHTLREGTNRVRPAPADRAEPGRPGGYLDDIDCFDHAFFGISAAEAATMDPQQRLLLQHAWLAVEDAAIPLAQFARDSTGVFMVAAPSEYPAQVEMPAESPFLLTSSSPCMYANRVSYLLDLRGPSEYCNTACSSAFVALHRAMQAIRAGDCRQALVGAVNLLLSPDETAGYQRMDFLSAQGQSRSFQAGGDGYVRSEGVGVVVLKSLGDAERDGDRIYARLKGSGVRHGGKGASLTAPDHDALQAAMVAAYRSGDIDPDSVDYVEAHGVGSPLGDAIELAALQSARAALGTTSPRSPWTISTVKPLIGHCELASGLAALFKVIDALEQHQLPGIPGFQQPDPALALDPRLVRLESAARPWVAPRDAQGVERPRRASLNSYGFGGVSAHLVVEEQRAVPAQAGEGSGPQLILLSARTFEHLREQARRLSQTLAERTPGLADIAYTLQVGRMAMACRWCCVAEDVATVRQRLDALASGSLEGVACLAEEAIQVAAEPSAPEPDVARALAEGDLARLAEQWRQGAAVDWSALVRPGRPRRIGLPGYPFARTRHWLPRRGQTLHQPPRPTPLLTFREVLAEVLGSQAADLSGCETRSLASLGLSSLGAVGLKARLEQHLGVSLSLKDLDPYRSLADTEACVAEQAGQGGGASLPAFQAMPEAQGQPFPLNDIQQSFLSGRTLLADAERVGCHIYLEFDWPELDVYRLTQAWNRLVDHHAMLRLVLLPDGRQRIGEAAPCRFRTRDLRRKTAADREATLESLRASMSHKVYLPGQSPLYEICVSLLDDVRSRVHLSIDELIVDATSLELLLQQWLALYRDEAAVLPALDVSFRDYLLSLEAYRQSSRYQRDLRYWLEKLPVMPPGLRLPKASRAAGRERRRLTSQLDASRWRRLKEQGAEQGISGTALLLTLFGSVLRQAQDGQAFSLIATFYGRVPLHPQVDQVLGPLISTHFFAVQAGRPDEGLAQQAQSAHRQLLEDIDHLSVSGVAALREAKRQAGHAPRAGEAEVVFTSMLNNPVIGRAASFGDAQHYCVTQTPQVNLDHQVREREGALHFSWDVAIACYPDGLIDDLFATYCALLERCADDPANRLAQPMDELLDACSYVTQRSPDATTGSLAPFALASGAAPATFALTDQQQAYAFGRSLQGGSAHLYLEVAMPQVDVERLERAWNDLLAIHPMLRARILPNGQHQIMGDVPRVPVETLGDPEGIADVFLSRATPLGEWPSAWIGVGPLADGRQAIHVGVDLLVADLPSRDRLVGQLLALYHGQSLARPSIGFGHYLNALNHYRRSPAVDASVRHWQARVAQLPTGPRLGDGANDGLHQGFDYQLRRWHSVRARAAKEGISADAVLITAYAWSLASHGFERPFTVVAPGWNRLPVHAEIDEVVGDFTTLSWIAFQDDARTFLEQARHCEQVFTEDLAHRAVSGLQAMRKATLDRRGAQPLEFPVVFTRLNPQGPLALPDGVEVITSASRTQGVVLDNLSLEQGGALHIHWDLAVGRLSPDGIQAMFETYCQVLERLAIERDAWLRDERGLLAAAVDDPA